MAAPTDVEVLRALHDGFNTMAELTDYFGLDSSFITPLIEKLEQQKLIGRLGGYGMGFYTFGMTAAGRARLGALSSREQELAVKGLNAMDVKMLDYIAANPNQFGSDMIDRLGIDGRHVETHIAKLSRLGYLSESGLWRRQVTLTEQGNAVRAKLGQAR